MQMPRNTPSPNLPAPVAGRSGGVFVFRVPPARALDLGELAPDARAGAVAYFAIQ